MTEEKIQHNKDFNFRSFTWPLILIFSGSLLLLNNLGIISWDVWSVIFHFWPVFLILAGLEYILGDSFISNLLTFLVALIIIAFIFIFSVSTVNSSFDKFLKAKYPFWNRIKKSIPEYRLQRQILRCPPWQPDCQSFYKY